MAEHNVIFELFYNGVWNRAPVLTRAGISYRRGQQGAGAEMDPARAKLTLDRGDIYAPKSALSVLRGKIGQNTPGRLTVDGSVRMLGEVSSWKPIRPVKGTPYTEIELSGVLRRIGRGNDPLHSPLYRAVYALSPVAYWAMEEGRDATAFSSALTGDPQLTYTGLTFAADDSLSGSLPLPQLAAGGSASATLNAADYAAGTWEVEWVTYMPSVPAATTTFMQIDTPGGTVASWVFYIDSAFPNVYGAIGYGPTGATVVSWTFTAAVSLTAQWLKMRFSAKQNGGNVDARFVYFPADVYGSVGGFHTETYAGTVGAPVGMGIPAAPGVAGWSIGHWASFTTYDISSSDGASAGWAGENAAVRFGRLCTEQGISRVISGDQPSSVVMGAQRPLPLLDLLEETANTDDGTVFEDRGVLGLTLRLGNSKLNQAPALTVSYRGHITPDLEPVLGDTGIRNDVTARNPDGSTRRAVQATGPRNVQSPSADPQGVGRYQTSIDVNTFTSAALAAAAAWRVSIGTYDGTWYAEVTVDLDAAPGLIAAVNAVDIGDVVGISELPAEEAIDTVYGVVVGIEEQLPAKRRLVTFYLVPADPYRTGKLAQTTGDTDPLVGYAETDGSATATTVASGAASFNVDTPSGPLWTTLADDFPQDVVVGGQRVSISGIGNALTAGFTATVSSAWPTADTGQTWALTGSAGDYISTGGRGLMGLGTTGVERAASVTGIGPDVDFTALFVPMAVAVGAQFEQKVRFRYSGSSTFYEVNLQYQTDGTVTLYLVRNATVLSSVASALAYSAASVIGVHVQAFGSTLRVRIWDSSGTEPTTWAISVTDATFPGNGTDSLYLVADRITGNTQTALAVAFDDVQVLNPQTFTVQPAGRQVVYPVDSGADVRVYQPLIPTM